MNKPTRYMLHIIIIIVLSACAPINTNDFEEIPDKRENVNSNACSTNNDCGNIVKKTLEYDDYIDVYIKSVSKWMSQVEGEKSNQGADCYKKYLCQFRVDYTSIDIMDMERKEFVTSIQLNSLGSAFHCNNADFSNKFYDNRDSFPLLYSSHQGEGARCIIVDRIYKYRDSYKLQTVQRIEIPCDEDEPLQYTPDAIIDNDNNYLYIYTGNTLPLTNSYIYKFRMPSIEEGELVRLDRSDIIDSWVIYDYPFNFKQGGMIKDDILYIIEGVPGWNSDNVLRVIDLKTCSFKLINLSQSFGANWEPEDIFIYDNHFYIASNRSGIFKIEMEKSENTTGMIIPQR